MTLNPILAARLRASGLLTRRPTVAAVVEQLLAVQAQDEPSTAYSFYLRTGLSAAAIGAGPARRTGRSTAEPADRRAGSASRRA